ncbi:MAG: alanine--tRNA ligase [Elusimicrobia bacterium GWF2_52_66]|nr:MAG: alanine--tRNA ligase [Elusimicrobia bacterium GWA2_51_34]OGR86697.1 MAG: alanine--tRNA ligase [Elusimicrobia bacterium GWF2_52_66]HAF95431.1 alanine--tRNA ligase [Elusimicrobiota bacterium]HCE99064.1 alanine--tRNA ligase [Elusimicrobiota bacterium]
MQSCEIRKKFLGYFKKQGHPVIKSSPLIPEGDPTLLFTSAGMVQFKPYYLGLKTDLKRAASCQKSFRTTDIDNVGLTIRHLTFFEMLGNFSFGDYFKAESIKWGWDFLTKELGLPEDRFYISIYGGGVAPKDEEARKIWESVLPERLHSRIIELGDDSNFWSMGDTGPSGPCSEIYWDRGEKFSHHNCLGAGCSCDRYIEIWNHVFTQFNRRSDGSFEPLPRKNIDTGMGLERLAFVVEDKPSPFDTTLFYPIIAASAKILKTEYSTGSGSASAFRIISDHLRAAAFLISEGVIPSNEGRGYVLRRLVRRAARYGRIMGAGEPFLYKLVPPVFEIFRDVYPEMLSAERQIVDALKFEEEGFIETLETGEVFLKGLMEKYPKGIPGKETFRLYETYGFPFELTRELALKNNIPVDEKGFNEARKAAQGVAKAGWKDSGEKSSFIFQRAEERFCATKFTGYEETETPAVVLGLINPAGNITESLLKGAEGYVVLDKTPFYSESGGQVGDTGLIMADGLEAAEVLDTQKPIGKVFFHKVKVLEPLKTGMAVTAVVSKARRRVASNHTAVHIVNAALMRVFGPGTRQAGSLVTADKFRFDYTVAKTPTKEELSKVEEISNAAVAENYRVFKMERPLKDAQTFGAVTLLGEKYMDPARFVLVNKGGWDDAKNRYSLELCGGTHIDALGELVMIKILKDSSVSRGVRRIEGVAGPACVEHVSKLASIAEEISSRLAVPPEELGTRISQLMENLKKNQPGKPKAAAAQVESAAEEVTLNASTKLVIVEAAGSQISALRHLCDQLKLRYSNALFFVFSLAEGKMFFVVAASSDLKNDKFNASCVAKEAADLLNGSGGGRKDFAQGGGVSPANLGSYKTQLIEIVKKHL